MPSSSRSAIRAVGIPRGGVPLRVLPVARQQLFGVETGGAPEDRGARGAPDTADVPRVLAVGVLGDVPRDQVAPLRGPCGRPTRRRLHHVTVGVDEHAPDATRVVAIRLACRADEHGRRSGAGAPGARRCSERAGSGHRRARAHRGLDPDLNAVIHRRDDRRARRGRALRSRDRGGTNASLPRGAHRAEGHRGQCDGRGATDARDSCPARRGVARAGGHALDASHPRRGLRRGRAYQRARAVRVGNHGAPRFRPDPEPVGPHAFAGWFERRFRRRGRRGHGCAIAHGSDGGGSLREPARCAAWSD